MGVGVVGVTDVGEEGLDVAVEVAFEFVVAEVGVFDVVELLGEVVVDEEA